MDKIKERERTDLPLAPKSNGMIKSSSAKRWSRSSNTQPASQTSTPKQPNQANRSDHNTHKCPLQTCCLIEIDDFVHKREGNNDFIKDWHATSCTVCGQRMELVCTVSELTNKSSISTLRYHCQPAVREHQHTVPLYSMCASLLFTVTVSKYPRHIICVTRS